MIQSGIQQRALWCLALQHLKCRYSKLNFQCWLRCLHITIHQIQEPKLVFKAANMLSAGMLSTSVWNVNLKFGSRSSFLGIQSSAFFLRARHYWIPASSSPVSCCRSLPWKMQARNWSMTASFLWFSFLRVTLQIPHEWCLMSCWILDLIFQEPNFHCLSHLNVFLLQIGAFAILKRLYLSGREPTRQKFW